MIMNHFLSDTCADMVTNCGMADADQFVLALFVCIICTIEPAVYACHSWI